MLHQSGAQGRDCWRFSAPTFEVQVSEKTSFFWEKRGAPLITGSEAQNDLPLRLAWAAHWNQRRLRSFTDASAASSAASTTSGTEDLEPPSAEVGGAVPGSGDAVPGGARWAVEPSQPTVMSPPAWTLTWDVQVLATLILTGRSP